MESLITNYARRRAGITLTPHQIRHLSAKVLLDDQPGGFETVRQLLGHKNLQTHGVFVRRDRQPSRRAASPASHRRSAIGSKSVSPAQASRQSSRVDKKAKVMPARRKLMLPFTHWPIEDRRRWEAAFQSGDLFDENGPGTRLAAATRQLRLESYGRFLGFLSAKHPKLMTRPPGSTDRSANGWPNM